MRLKSPFIAPFIALGGSSSASSLYPRQLNTSSSTGSVNTTAPIPLSQSTISQNQAPYEEDASKYYLGYYDSDFARPFAKYWNPNVLPISDEVQKGLSESPKAKPLAFPASQAKDYMTRPGYLQMENGYSVGEDGSVMIAVRTDIPDITGEMYDWWFGWHLVDSARYKLWNPVAHQYAWRFPETLDWANKTLPQRYIGTFSQIDEYIGNDAQKITIAFVDPVVLGFEKEKWAEQGIETIVTARILIGHSSELLGPEQYLIHQVRRREDGSRELRSRFWLQVFTPQIAHDLLVHCNIEMTHLNCFLPALFQEFKDTL
ncbi:hypothetical protein GTA08_BOTSDO09760 [Neofusicoccum parvum]|uniref:Uncharacterized protein n=1 Tax=Neofusicoccum parvum TaxID=310453 RepID=A0ACB5RS10_9PEZI|nr:hypothetical protein GTA08_BOTSDO09760 [Neofusicoccum parvum]